MANRIGIMDIAAGVLRGSYRRLAVDLGGPMRALNLGAGRAGRWAALPKTMALGDAARGLEILDGQFVLGNQSLDVGAHGDPWLVPAPSENFAYKLHSFEWLTDVAAITLDKKLRKKHPQSAAQAGLHARHLVDRWIDIFGKWNPYAWENDILASRLFSWFSNWETLLGGDEDEVRGAARRASVLRQLKRLRGTYKRTPAGLPRLKAAACLVLGGACLPGKQDGFLDRGLDLLDDEIEKQILPDGGHISRSPEQTTRALEILIVTESALEAAELQGSKEIRRAIDRLTPMVSFFGAGDGGLFSFNGGGMSRPGYLKQLQSHTKIKAKQFGYAPHTKYQRLERNGIVLMIDTGAPPPRPFDLGAHLAPLAFEMATPDGRLIVGCGWNDDQPESWRQPMRASAAHSTLVLGGKSVGALLSTGLGARAIGHAVKQGAQNVKCARKEQDSGTWLEISHDAYKDGFGLIHRRRLYMDLVGTDIRGEDSLSVPLGAAPLMSGEIPFEIRFHLHPDVKVTLAQDQKSALLIQPGGKGWRFRTDAGPLHLEKSVYLADGSKPRRSEQIVIFGRAYGDGDGQTRSNRVRWSLKKMGLAE